MEDMFPLLGSSGQPVTLRPDGLVDIGTMRVGVPIDEALLIECRLRWWPRPYRAFYPERDPVPQRLCGGWHRRLSR
jgi:hypothetical protein